MIHLAIIGSRLFNDYTVLESTILQKYNINNITIISGGEIGTDTLAQQFADTHNIQIDVFRPNWKLYGNKAEYIRNRLMVVESDEIIAFWNGTSVGTKSKIDFANSISKPITVINV